MSSSRGTERRVRMANLVIVGSHSTNGVSAIHTGLLRTTTVKDLAEMFPERFNNKTNGVTPRRWLLLANPALAGVITTAIDDGWVSDLGRLRQLVPLADDKSFREAFRDASHEAKSRFAIGSRQQRARLSTPPAFSTVKSSASTNTSGSCSTRFASSFCITGCARTLALS